MRFPDRHHDQGLGRDFMYEDSRPGAGPGGRRPSASGIVHYLYDYSPDMEYLEIVARRTFKNVDVPPASDKVPPVTPWK